MISKRLRMDAVMVTLSSLVIGCVISEQNATKSASVGFITTPASYYTSAKARYLGTKYKENLTRLAERIVRHPKTAHLQFANNIASFGGIGFFTHGATSIADERFLEVIMSAPETFASKEDVNTKVSTLFAAYGKELLSILAEDPDIYQEKELSGYGLNFTWRSLLPDSKGTRVALEQAVIYVAKDKVRGFLHQEMDQNNFLGNATIFTSADNGPMNLVSYRQQEPRLDTRLPIQEESLAVSEMQRKADSGSSPESGRETVKEELRPAQGRAAGIASEVPMPLANQQTLAARRQEQVPVSKPTETVKQASGDARQGRDSLRDTGTEVAKRFDGEARGKESVAQPPSVATKTQEAPTSDPGDKTRASEKGSVTKAFDDSSEVKKADARANTPATQKVNHHRDAKSGSGTRKPDSVPTAVRKKSAPGGDTAESAVTHTAQSEASGVADSESGTSGPPLKAADEKRTALARKNATGAQTSLITEAQPKVEKKLPPPIDEQLPITGKSSAANTVEPQRRTGGNQFDMAKATDPHAENPMVGDSQRGATARSASDKPVTQSIALQKNKTSETMPKGEARVGAQSKTLEGYIIQLAFKDKARAQRWAETMERRGYAVSVTEAGGMESVRVRVGSFVVREEADRQLLFFKQEGLSGIVINLPQAYRPGARAQSIEKSETPSAQSH